MKEPLIGITTSHLQSSTGVLHTSIPEAYSQALAQAGALPVLIPLGLPAPALLGLLARLDGVLFAGGGDVHPRRYGAEHLPLSTDINEERDRVELILLENLLTARRPFLGICRGLQLINVGLGGTLYQDILASRPDALSHQHIPGNPRSYLAHPVQVLPGTRLEAVLGCQTARVNSLHHQGVDRLAPRLKASALAPDGLIEAFELEDYPFGLAVQWHPEWLTGQAEMNQIFRAFVAAAASQK